MSEPVRISAPVESHLHPTPSFDVAGHPVPTGREEIWRFTPIDAFAPLFDETVPEASPRWTTQVPAGVTLETIDAETARGESVGAPADRIAAVAVARAQHPVRVTIPAEADITDPILLEAEGQGETGVGRLIVKAGHHARATVVLRYRGTGAYAARYDVDAAEGADLTIVSIAEWDDTAVHGGEIAIKVGRGAHVRTVDVALGGKAVRNSWTASYDGPGGELEQFGLYFADAGQHLEHRLFVDHNEPNTGSLVDYRGALQGEKAHSVWVGDVLIRECATGIRTYEQNRNLVLTDGCIADSIPNLEIETGEIEGAGHSSSTGRFDDEQLFYLMSRGIPANEAKRLVVEGFFQTVLHRIGVPELEDKLMDAVRTELATTVGELQ